MREAPAQDAAGITEWLALSDALLRGLVHALNNRLTALSALGELAALGDADFAAERVLPGELSRLQEVGALFRLLATEEGPPEPMELGPAIDEAVALAMHHHGRRVVRCTALREGVQGPVRVPRWALMRLLLVLLEAGRAAAEDAGRDTTVLRVTGSEDSVLLHGEGATLPPYAVTMARVCGATIEGSGAGVRLPTLAQLRRRERAAREAAAG